MGEQGGKGMDRQKEGARQMSMACTRVMAVGLVGEHGLKYFTIQLSTGFAACELKEESKHDS